MYLDSFLTLPLINLLLDLSPEERAVLEHPNVDVEAFVWYEVEVDGSITLCRPRYPDIVQFLYWQFKTNNNCVLLNKVRLNLFKM